MFDDSHLLSSWPIIIPSLLHYFFFLGLNKKLLHSYQTRRKIRRQESTWKKKKWWDGTKVHFLLIQFQMLVQIFYLMGQRRQDGPGVIYLKILLHARHSLRFLFPFLLTSLEICTLSPILQMANLRLTEYVNFPGSNVYTLPATQINQQPPV